MPSANRMTTVAMIDVDELEGRYAPLGDYTVSFETFRQDVDPAPYFVGLSGDRCQCAHWGVVTEGQLTFRWSTARRPTSRVTPITRRQGTCRS
jgi:hypothetical protein